ncbi:hypothetical protein WN944_026819 [Citrus x changshan-huyou]|uniref:Uncharacterized protein n=1 Tax=Citrus x changshan-huyou TaxID=2935761 RepID=A0AAP0Q7Y0_9ROSI
MLAEESCINFFEYLGNYKGQMAIKGIINDAIYCPFLYNLKVTTKTRFKSLSLIPFYHEISRLVLKYKKRTT